MSFVRAANPIWFMVDLTGSALNDQYYAFFLQNTLPYLPQPVYQDPNGINAWSNPVEFQPSGTLPNNLYFNPALTYRIEIRQGNTQNAALIWLIENYVPSQGEGVIDQLLSSDNMITNPQFADILFSSPLTITTAGTYRIAPGWQIVTTGSGSTTITQGTNPGSSDITGNPAYFLEFDSSGWASVYLTQTFNNNGAIFSGGSVSSYLLARATSAIANISVTYAPSVGVATNILSNTQIAVGSFLPYSNSVNIPASTNSSTGTAAFVNFQITLPSTGMVALSNIQLTGQSTPIAGSVIAPPYAEITYERMVDHEFHVYRNSIIMQPKDSLLVGWNFGLNPWQFYTTSAVDLPVNAYTADQTIVIQQNYVTNATGNNILTGKGGYPNNYVFSVGAVSAHNQFGILQYIDAASTRPYWNDYISQLSSLVTLYFLTSASTGNVFIKMRLIAVPGTPSSISQTYPIASWTENGDPVFSGGITVITPRNDPKYNVTGAGVLQFPFEGMVLPQSSNINMTLGLFVYSVGLMNPATDSINFSDISLVPNEFAIASNPKTFDQTLRECQYYYAKTFPQGTQPGYALGNSGAIAYNAIFSGADTGSAAWQFPSIMRSNSPTMTYFSTALPTNDNWYNSTSGIVSGDASSDILSNRGVYIGNPQVSGDVAGDLLVIHATADARLGI